MTPHSMALPHRFSSIEYSFSLVSAIGMSHLARTRRSVRGDAPDPGRGQDLEVGARGRVPTSKRTWSLPLPVHPWATAWAP